MRRNASSPWLIASLVFLTGCVASRDRVSLQQLPGAWQAGIKSGTGWQPGRAWSYSDRGEISHEYAITSGTPMPRAHLSHLLFPEVKPPIKADKVQLTLRGMDELEIIASLKGQVVSEKTLVIQIDPASGGMILPDERGLRVGGNLAAAVKHAGQVCLILGGDGHLYYHAISSDYGVVAVVVPMSSAAENWGRWSPARE